MLTLYNTEPSVSTINFDLTALTVGFSWLTIISRDTFSVSDKNESLNKSYSDLWGLWKFILFALSLLGLIQDYHL